MNEQGSAAWLQERCGYATASRANDLLATTKTGYGAGRKNYMAELVVERLTGAPIPDGFVSEPMKRGTEMEPYARSWYQDKTGNFDVTQMGFIKHPTIPWVGCSIDSEVEDGVGGLEIKCPNTATHFEALLAGAIPSKNIAQVQFQMWVMGWQWVDFVSFDDRVPKYLQGFLVRVPRDAVYVAALEIEVVKFLTETDAMVAKLKAYK